MQQGLTDADRRRLERLITRHRRQRAVAKLLGLSESAVSRYRNGKSPKEPWRVQAVRDAIGKALGQ